MVSAPDMPDSASSVNANLQGYVAAGYFVSRWTGAHDCTGTKLRRVSMAHDHSQRRFFPETWALSWCNEARERRIGEAAMFGIAEAELDQVMSWADAAFGSVFGAWDLFFDLDDARAAARSFLRNAADLELWGVGLHQTLVSTFCQKSAPSAPKAGHEPLPTALHRAICMRPSPLVGGGIPLGHEVLVASVGCTFNSPESLHIDEGELLRDASVVRNADGLIDSLDDALACCRLLEPAASDARGESELWLPWLIARYAP
ncbi:hypothetical protein [Anaeromyxobacter oryzae]|uniref:Uncharacterized protein n=1 Tax=Anaeromyxobacter oryzae TaxID=2918170 RepID=A0ABM7X1Q5_9BACT|nr:hypothetical protein [Anaeromyxobacter oryzae]BDG05721.1 hypothetical protein AMOR_47170 [Anaeromyxobacter oryzae]